MGMSFLLKIKLRTLFDVTHYVLNCIKINIYITRLHTLYLLMSRIRSEIGIKAANKNYYIQVSKYN